jgi:hypothetical protein
LNKELMGQRMPMFHLDIREEGRFVPDEEGMELRDFDTAEREAAEIAAAIGRDKLPLGKTRAIIVEVRNEYGQPVLTVAVTLVSIRVAPPPVPPAARDVD